MSLSLLTLATWAHVCQCVYECSELIHERRKRKRWRIGNKKQYDGMRYIQSSKRLKWNYTLIKLIGECVIGWYMWLDELFVFSSGKIKQKINWFEVKMFHSSKSGQIVFGYNVGYVEIFINFFVFDILNDNFKIHSKWKKSSKQCSNIQRLFFVFNNFLKRRKSVETPSNATNCFKSIEKVVNYFDV